MRKIFPEYKRSTVYAMIGMAFHFVVVVIPLIFHGFGTGWVKGVGWLTLFFDFPLTLLEVSIGALEHLVVTSTIGYILFYSMGGTLLYGLGGWVMGILRDAFLGWRF